MTTFFLISNRKLSFIKIKWPRFLYIYKNKIFAGTILGGTRWTLNAWTKTFNSICSINKIKSRYIKSHSYCEKKGLTCDNFCRFCMLFRLSTLEFCFGCRFNESQDRILFKITETTQRGLSNNEHLKSFRYCYSALNFN